MRLRKALQASIVIAFVVVMVSLMTNCAHVPQTPEGKYLTARTAYNNTYENYLDALELQPVEVQEEWDIKTGKLWVVFDEALNTWHDVISGIDATMTPERAEQIYRSVKIRLFTLLQTFGVETED